MRTEKVVHPFEPVYSPTSRVLILGSFPSVVSRERMFYYAHPSNRFWKVMAILFDEEIKDRKQFCLNHDIALWDVIYSCTITGSSDSSIKNVQVNDIDALIQKTNIGHIFTTGKTASSLYDRYIHVSVPHISLASTSSANAVKSLEDLVREYTVILEVLHEES